MDWFAGQLGYDLNDHVLYGIAIAIETPKLLSNRTFRDLYNCMIPKPLRISELHNQASVCLFLASFRDINKSV